jgi:hypothetical protein
MPAVLHPKQGFESYGSFGRSDLWWILVGVLLALLFFPFGRNGS